MRALIVLFAIAVVAGVGWFLRQDEEQPEPRREEPVPEQPPPDDGEETPPDLPPPPPPEVGAGHEVVTGSPNPDGLWRAEGVVIQPNAGEPKTCKPLKDVTVELDIHAATLTIDLGELDGGTDVHASTVVFQAQAGDGRTTSRVRPRRKDEGGGAEGMSADGVKGVVSGAWSDFERAMKAWKKTRQRARILYTVTATYELRISVRACRYTVKVEAVMPPAGAMTLSVRDGR